MGGIYKVLVTVSTHDFLKEGRTAVSPFVNGREPFERQVVVWAESDHEAVLIAAQMASCTSGLLDPTQREDRLSGSGVRVDVSYPVPGSGMCTGALLSDWPDSA